VPKYGWTLVDSYWCPHQNIETRCTLGTHATFILPEDYHDEGRAAFDLQAALPKWTKDFPKDDVDREDNLGLKFECQLNTPTLTSLYQLRELGCINTMALRRTLLDRQDLILIGADDFVEENIIEQEDIVDMDLRCHLSIQRHMCNCR